jgi:hypothetical protein
MHVRPCAFLSVSLFYPFNSRGDCSARGRVPRIQVVTFTFSINSLVLLCSMWHWRSNHTSTGRGSHIQLYVNVLCLRLSTSGTHRYKTRTTSSTIPICLPLFFSCIRSFLLRSIRNKENPYHVLARFLMNSVAWIETEFSSNRG